MGKKKLGENKTCQACKIEFYVPKYRIETAKFCSLLCQNHKQYDKYFFECEICKKKCVTSPCRRKENKKFCSTECRSKSRQSEKKRREKSRIHNILTRGYSSSRQIRRWIWEFKEKKCELCGYNEFDFCLDIHHEDKNPQNNCIDNLIILCVMCHRKHHKGVINASFERKK